MPSTRRSRRSIPTCGPGSTPPSPTSARWRARGSAATSRSCSPRVTSSAGARSPCGRRESTRRAGARRTRARSSWASSRLARPGPGTARLAGATRVHPVGGAQAVAALAYGTDTIPPVDIIAGPGNAYVTEAKRQVFGHVAIDGLAGPSDVVVVASGDAEPATVALDLLA